jgi:hypothetical protein
MSNEANVFREKTIDLEVTAFLIQELRNMPGLTICPFPHYIEEGMFLKNDTIIYDKRGGKGRK